ncbi:MAG TPA: hypothetical protein VKF80_04350 [Candidatus Eisenbacteria bacterium]|nr:hypothetical protein [Candidatus Eisenbacteria bacterium]
MVTAFYDARLHRFESLTVLVDSSRGLRFIVAKPKDGKVVWSSTQSGEKRRTLSLNSNREAIFYDALPMWLRGLDLQTPSKDSVAMLPTQLSGQGDNLVPTEIHVIGPAGPPSMTSHGGLEVEVHYAGKVDRFWFHPGPTHMLLAWDKADGTQIAYKGSKRE